MSEINIYQLREIYIKRRIGTVVKAYDKDDEMKYYFYVCKKLSEKYPEIVKGKETLDKISGEGRILTAGLDNKNNGMFDEEYNNVLINHFLDRMTTFLFHEVVHKIGFMNSNGQKQLPRPMREAGTEKITAETMMNRNTKGYIFSNIWARFPNTISTYFLDYTMISQLSFFTPHNSLESSILNGDCSFLEQLKDTFGDEDSKVIINSFNEMSKQYDYYSKFYKVLSQREKNTKLSEIEKNIARIQSITLKAFDKMAEGVSTTRQANVLLSKMLEYSEYRVRRKEDDGFHDDEFENYFNMIKARLQERFKSAKFKQSFNSNSWNGLEDFHEVEQILPDERTEIDGLKRKILIDTKRTKLLSLLKIEMFKKGDREK